MGLQLKLTFKWIVIGRCDDFLILTWFRIRYTKHLLFLLCIKNSSECVKKRVKSVWMWLWSIGWRQLYVNIWCGNNSKNSEYVQPWQKRQKKHTDRWRKWSWDKWFAVKLNVKSAKNKTSLNIEESSNILMIVGISFDYTGWFTEYFQFSWFRVWHWCYAFVGYIFKVWNFLSYVEDKKIENICCSENFVTSNNFISQKCRRWSVYDTRWNASIMSTSLLEDNKDKSRDSYDMVFWLFMSIMCDNLHMSSADINQHFMDISNLFLLLSFPIRNNIDIVTSSYGSLYSCIINSPSLRPLNRVVVSYSR